MSYHQDGTDACHRTRSRLFPVRKLVRSIVVRTRGTNFWSTNAGVQRCEARDRLDIKNEGFRHRLQAMCRTEQLLVLQWCICTPLSDASNWTVVCVRNWYVISNRELPVDEQKPQISSSTRSKSHAELGDCSLRCKIPSRCVWQLQFGFLVLSPKHKICQSERWLSPGSKENATPHEKCTVSCG
jgi:hypothetical protein